MKLQVPTEIQSFSRFRVQNFLTGVAETVQPPDSGASSIKGTGKSLPSCRGVVCGMVAFYIPCVFCSSHKMNSKQGSWALFSPSNPQIQLAALAASTVAQPLLPCPCTAAKSAWPHFCLLGVLRISSAQPGKHHSNFCRWREGRYAPLARSQLHRALRNQHQQLTSTFRHFINLLHLSPAKLFFPDSLPITQ